MNEIAYSSLNIFASLKFGWIRPILASLLLVNCFLTPALSFGGTFKDGLPLAGKSLSQMETFDRRLLELMSKWNVPGTSVAYVYKGKLIYWRAYGYADTSKKQPVQPASLFRIASVSKLLTSVAILKLVEEAKLNLDTPALQLLEIPKDPQRLRDARLELITVRHLLECSAGWNRNSAGDPMFLPLAAQAAQEFSNNLRPTARAIVRYSIGFPLDTLPGKRFAYSNLGYSILGQIIAKVSGMKYEEYVRRNILLPMGISEMKAGKTREAAPGEVHYYGFPREEVGASIMPNVRGYLPLEYGGNFYLEAMTADCGWIANSADLAIFISSVFGERGKAKQVLSDRMVSTMIEKPDLDQWQDQADYFAKGWEVENSDEPERMIVKKDGCLPGSTTVSVHRMDGKTMVICFNTRPQQSRIFQDEVKALILDTFDSSQKWLSTSK
ncbi:MAG: beta-lactamase family protein [Candidatus Obscuribacterales bacterium]|nr:beta-lactamase family protein [Candidatus Obscuribacterales bacterium]